MLQVRFAEDCLESAKEELRKQLVSTLPHYRIAVLTLRFLVTEVSARLPTPNAPTALDSRGQRPPPGAASRTVADQHTRRQGPFDGIAVTGSTSIVAG